MIAIVFASLAMQTATLTAAQADRIAYQKCGPEGYNDWDNWGPVCERQGWNGRRYVVRRAKRGRVRR